MKNMLLIILIIAALIVLLPTVFKLTFSILAMAFKIVFFIVLAALVWHLFKRLRRLL